MDQPRVPAVPVVLGATRRFRPARAQVQAVRGGQGWIARVPQTSRSPGSKW